SAIGSGILSGQATTWQAVISNQAILASWYGFCAFLSALLITVILPFVEKVFDIQTDLTLLEWSDPSHELLNKMIQRAPGTYNHSINVASIAETAADAIGANGLLCRVAAYFHDVGKMLKPEYFVENQTSGENKHNSLVPAMSSIVIIAHVKDGIELARKHKLPASMIDMIEQHHGTTLVEYFYDQAVKEASEKGLIEEVDESNFRYPGPKPQTKEACVMMLADAVESACRTLTEPAPARIESLVKEISSRKLNDGQFAECPLTLRELHRIEQSLTKSLISVYHSRIKYPEQNGND
ncbi:MAG: HDIG domain-containing metalloprotein, partial [Planctomycetota bacterium]|nr:HDIG domain-containing metalloprotein [Planctomycetota bacterium]